MTDFQKVGVVSNGIRGIRGINDCRNDDAWKFSFGFWRTIEEVCRWFRHVEDACVGFGNLYERFVNGAESGWLRFWYCMLIRIINKLLLSRMKYENLCSQIVSVANCLDDWDIRQLFILLRLSAVERRKLVNT